MDRLGGAGAGTASPPAPCRLPAGELAFVLTDIVGSTRLFRRLGPSYVGLLLAHREVLRQACSRHAGVVVEAEGDSVLAVFTSAAAAIEAMRDARSLLADPQWPGGHPLRLRVAVHLGYAEPIGDEYIALGVHETARILRRAEPDQILTSTAVVDVLDPLTRGRCHSVGVRGLRDFDEPVELFAVGDPGADMALAG